MKIKLDYDKVLLLAKYMGVETMGRDHRVNLKSLCNLSGVKYYTMLNNRYKDCGIKIEDAYRLSVFLKVPINDIIIVEEG